MRRCPDLLASWTQLGQDLVARGPHRLRLALHASRAAATGGGRLTSHEEDQIAVWFTGIVEGAIRRGGDDAASAIWFVLTGDADRDPHLVGPPRCSAVAGSPCPKEEGCLAALQDFASGYARTVIAGASDGEIAELCGLLVATDTALDIYRPGRASLVEETPAVESPESALSYAMRRPPTNADLCRSIESWASGCASMVAKHAMSPVHRIGVIAWLAKVALADAASDAAAEAAEGGAP